MSEAFNARSQNLNSADDRNSNPVKSAEAAIIAAETCPETSLLDLPYDMIDAVVRRVDMRSLSALACVCHSLNQLTVILYLTWVGLKRHLSHKKSFTPISCVKVRIRCFPNNEDHRHCTREGKRAILSSDFTSNY